MSTDRTILALAKPCLKWAGGKTQLLDKLCELLPRKIQTYYEPFFGGGALFFRLANRQLFQKAVINDYNPELVNLYRVVRDFPEDLVTLLKAFEVSKEFFLELRATDVMTLSPLQQAARTIYLNKTCFNGLYRQNKKGQFNTPWGKRKNPKIADEPVIYACAEALNRHVAIHNTDFTEVVEEAEFGDLVYFDPPYVPISKTSNFANYTAEGFTNVDQARLAECFRGLVERGVAVIASNSSAPHVFELYAEFEINRVQARRSINSKKDNRGPIDELIIVGRLLGPLQES